MRDVSQQVATLIDPRGARTLGGLGTMQRVLGRLKEEGDILPISLLPTLTTHLVMIKYVSGMDGTIMVQRDLPWIWRIRRYFPIGRDLPHMVEVGGHSCLHFPNT